MNTDGGRVLPFPCWPREIDVRFRLHTPGGGILEGEQRNGQRTFVHKTAEAIPQMEQGLPD